MIEIERETKKLKLSPYDRLNEPDARAYDRLMVWVEFEMPNLKTEFSVEFAAGQLEDMKSSLGQLHQALITQTPYPEVLISDLFHQVELTFHPSEDMKALGLNIVLRPENNADSLTLTDFVGIDESYLPSILFGLSEILDFSQ